MKSLPFTLMATLCVFNAFSQSTGDYRSNTTSGNWNNSGSWQTYNGSSWVAASDYPGQSGATSATVTIRDGHTITLTNSPSSIGNLVIGEGSSGTFSTNNGDRTLTVTGNLTVKAGASFNLRRMTLTVSGNTQIDGSVTDNHDNGSATFTGTVTIGSAGSLSTSNSSNFTFSGAITNDGTVDLSGGGTITIRNGITNNNSFSLPAVTFATNSQSLNGSSAITITGVTTVTGITLTNNNTDVNLTSTANNSLTGSGTWTQGANGVLKFSGASMNITGMDFSASGNTVNYTRGGAQTINSTTYRNLTVSNSGTKTLGGDITVNGNLEISGSATLACDVYQITGNASGTFTMASGTTLTLGNTGSSTDVLFPTNFTASNISLNSSSTVTYQNNSTQTVSGTPAYGNLTIATGGTKTINGNTTVAGNLTISAGTFDLGTTATSLDVTGSATVTGTLSFSGTTTKTVTIGGDLSGAGTINMSGGSLLHTLNLGGANNSITTFTTAAVASTVNYNRSGDQQVFGSANYRSLTISGSGTKSLQANSTINNTFTVNSGVTFDPLGRNFTVSGSSVISGTFSDSNTGGSNSFQDVDLSGGTVTGTVTDNFTISGNLTMPDGNGTIGRANLTVSGTTTIASGRSLTLNNNTGVKTFVGKITVEGSGSWTSTTVSTAANLIIRGGIDVQNAAGSFSAGAATFNTNSQTIEGAGALSFADAVTISGAITITNTNTAGVTFNNTVDGSAGGSTWRNEGVTYYQPSATTQPMNTGTLHASTSGNDFYYSRAGNQDIKAITYHHLHITGGSGTKSLLGATTVNGNLNIASSTTFDPVGQNITVSGTANIAGTFAESNTAGTDNLTHVNLSGGTINGNVTEDISISGNLTLPDGNGTIGQANVTVGGTTTIASGRTLTINSNTGVKRFDGTITVNGSGSFISTTVTTAANLDLRGGIDVASSSGSFTAGAATFNASQTVTGAGAISFANAVTVNGSITVTNTNTMGVTFNGTIDGTVAGSTWTNDANGVTYYQPSAATRPMNTGTLNASATGNYFYYSRGGNQDIKAPASSYYHLYITGGSGTKSLLANTTVAGNLYVGASTAIDAGAYDFTVSGTSTLDGTFNDGSSTGTNTFTGLLTVSGTGSLSTSANSPFIFEGGITNNGTFSKTGTGAVSFNTSNQDIAGTAAITLAGNVTIASGITVTYKNTSSSGITLSGILDGANSSSTWKCNANTVVNYQPAAATRPMNTGVLDASGSGSTFSYSRTGAQTIKVPSSAYHNLSLSGGSVTKTLSGEITVNGNLSIGSSVTLDVDAAQHYGLTVKGNFVNSGTFQARNGTVTFNGSASQQVTSNGSSFYNLVIDNSSTGVTLNDNLTVSNLLTLTDGVVTTGTNRVIISSSSATSLSGFSGQSFINGNLRRYIGINTDTYVFPIGNGTAETNYYRADLINGNLKDITFIDAKFKPLTGHDDAELDVADVWEHGSLHYTSINTAGVWELEPDNPPSEGSYSIRLYIANMSGLNDNEFGPLKRPAGSTSGADWSTGGGTLNNNDTPGRTVASGYMQRNNLTSFSEFGGGSGSGSGAGLPIELLSFTAEAQGDMVKIQWVTAAEINNDFFTVERSQNGEHFETLAVFEGAGSSSQTRSYQTFDRMPLQGWSYYRLRQTDFNGRYTYSKSVSVYIGKPKPTVKIYPNPLSGSRLFIQIGDADSGSPAQVEIMDASGRRVFSSIIQPFASGDLTADLSEKLSTGIYHVIVSMGTETIQQKLLVK